MAHIRPLESGLWQATVYTPAGRRYETHELRGTIAKWAADLEADVRRGEFIDPRLAESTVAYCWARLGPARRLEKASRKRDASIWRCWVEVRWGSVTVGSILKPDVQVWVNQMEEDGVGGWTIIAAANLLKALLELAVDARMIRANPARRVKTPMPPSHVDRVIDAHEETLILDRLDELFPDRRDARLFVEGLLETGCRWEELAAVKREAVGLRRITIGPVMERDGTIREYPKAARSRDAAGFRSVSIAPAYYDRLRPYVDATARGGLVFTAPEGGPLLYPTWRHRVWRPALRWPVLDERGKPIEWIALVREPLPTPHDCRHTYGTRLADAGLELHDRMALMGHADVRSAQRYAHSGETRFDAAERAKARAREER